MADFYKSSSFNGMIPIALDGTPGGPLAGDTKWRGVPNLEHSTLCRAFSLDTNRFYWEIPSSMRGVGSNMSGYGGNRMRRELNGYVWMPVWNASTPVAKFWVVREGQKFKDIDPSNQRDFLDLGHI
jgi:hypothetical protein